MCIWLARSTTATRALALASAVCLQSAVAPAGDDIARLAESTAALARGPIPSEASLRALCDGDLLCAAHRLVEVLGPRARLEAVRHPDSDSIRGVKTQPSVLRSEPLGEDLFLIELARFGRKAVAEVQAGLAAAEGRSTLRLDLRRNGGGDLDGMLRVAALFTGPVDGAVELAGHWRVRRLAIPDSARPPWPGRLEVVVGPETASSAEFLAALLRVHAGARLLGGRSYGKDYLLRVVPVTHDWRLLVPSEDVTVPGSEIAGGLWPDAPYRGDGAAAAVE